MEIELRKEQIQNYTRLYDQLICREESIEAVVPDVMPDVQQIMDAEAQVYLRGKETEDGRLSVSAFLEGTVLYQPEGENSLRRLNLSGNVSIAFDDPAIPRGGVVQLALGCTSADARMLNPRKVLLRAEICVRAIVFRPELSVYSAEAGAEGLQTLCKTETVQYIAAVEEKSFVLAEDFDLPGGGELHELLRSRLRLETGEVRAVAGKLIVQGNACLDILYCAAAGELPRTASFSAAFSQIVDVHGEYGGPCSVDLVPTALYVEPVNGSYGGATVSMELHLVAQALCADEREIRYLADAYSNACPCQVELAPLRLGGIGHSTLLRETVRETLECGESIAEVLEACAVAGRAAATDGKLRVPVSVHVLCRGERGSVLCLDRRLFVECPLPLELEDAQPGFARCVDPYAAVIPGGVELRTAVEAEMYCNDEQELCPVAALTLDTEAPPEICIRPSITAVRCRGEELWELAKKYGSTPELIQAANPEGFGENAFLLIPRCR